MFPSAENLSRIEQHSCPYINSTIAAQKFYIMKARSTPSEKNHVTRIFLAIQSSDRPSGWNDVTGKAFALPECHSKKSYSHGDMMGKQCHAPIGGAALHCLSVTVKKIKFSR
jgi:hypothetical protein